MTKQLIAVNKLAYAILALLAFGFALISAGAVAGEDLPETLKYIDSNRVTLSSLECKMADGRIIASYKDLIITRTSDGSFRIYNPKDKSTVFMELPTNAFCVQRDKTYRGFRHKLD